MTLTNNHVFNTKTRQFQPWADWVLDAIEDKEIELYQKPVSEWIVGGAE